MPELNPELAWRVYRALGLDPNYVRSVTLKLVPGQPISLTYERAAEEADLKQMIEALQRNWR